MTSDSVLHTMPNGKSSAGEAAGATSDTSSTQARTPWQRVDWLILVAVLLLGGALRFYQIGSVPVGFQFDEAYNALDAEQVLQGNYPLFLPANGGREVLYTYFQAGLIALLGSSVWSFRLASAIWGTLAVGAAFVLFRLLLRRDSRLVATFAATALAISYWHIHFSHFGIRVITMPVIFSGLFGAFFWATEASSRRQRLAGYVLAGVLLGASVWSNPTGRLAPFILVAWVAVLLWRNPDRRTLRLDAPIAGLCITGLVAFLIFLPLGITFYQHPEFFFGHASEVSIFAERVSGEQGPVAALLDNLLHVLGMFSFYGDQEWTHGIPGRPVLDWAIAIPFYVGVVIWVLRLFGRGRKDDPDGDALWLLALWVGVMLAPSILSDAAPNYSRTLPALPVVLLPIGLGLTWLVRLHWSRAWMRYALAGALLGASLIWTFYDYFVRFPQMEQAYYAYDVDKADALALLRERGGDHQVYLSPLWATHAPVRWLREGSGIKTLEPAQTLALPANQGVVYAYTGEEGARAGALAARIGEMLGMETSVAVEEVRDKYDRPLLWLVTLDPTQVDALDAADVATGTDSLPAYFDDAPTLLGASLDAQGALLLAWRAEATTFRDLTAFAHFINADGTRVAQVDRIPGDGSFPTYTWSAGERVIDRMQPEYSALCTSGATVRVVTGWYEYAADGARRPRSDAPGDMALAGEFVLPMRALDEEEIIPDVLLENPEQVGPVEVVGYTLHGDGVLRAGGRLEVDLYYRTAVGATPLTAQVRLNGDPSGITLAEASIPAQATEASDAIYCQQVTLYLDSQEDASSLGQEQEVPLQLWLGASDSDGQGSTSAAPFLVITVDPAQPMQQTPAEATPLTATIGGEIALDGVTVGELADDALEVALYWRATDFGTYANTAFVQLLDADGKYVAGADVQPDPPSRAWRVGETQVTRHRLILPPDLPAGEYSLVAGMYDALLLDRLVAVDGEGTPFAENLVPAGALLLGTQEGDSP